ncbi:MAG: protein serine/threonine phosphatase, partial [Frankiales bacterium]|nr:protein serine/threonine phosphatase [Frankiales bacterium]
TRATPVAVPAERRRHGRRLAVVAALAIALLLAGAGAGWAYVRSQYYVGADGPQVAVFRGVTGHVAGVSLSSIDERTDLRTDQLGELDAARVQKGIVAKSRSDAQQIVERLKSLACPTAVPAPSPAPVASAPAASPVPSPHVTVVPAPAPTASAGCP